MLDTAIRAAREAGKIVLEHYGNAEESFKFDRICSESIVTETDLESEKKIKEIISERFPDHNFVGEETGATSNNSEYSWYIDPIDGTGNYCRRILDRSHDRFHV